MTYTPPYETYLPLCVECDADRFINRTKGGGKTAVGYYLLRGPTLGIRAESVVS